MNWRKMVKIAAFTITLALALALGPTLGPALGVFASFAHAQQTQQTHAPPDPLDLIRNFTCVSPGYGVVTIRNKPDLNNLATAERLGGSNELVIWVRTDLMQLFRPITRVFWLEHECAHHRLGHTQFSGHPSDAQSAREEDEADCAALKVLVDPNDPKIDGDGLRDIQADMDRLPGAGFYPSGAERARRMSACVLAAGQY